MAFVWPTGALYYACARPLLIVDMRDADGQAGRRPEFDAAFARFLGQNSRRSALVRKLKEVRLTS